VFQLSQVFGNLLSSFVLDDSASSRDTLIYIFLGLSVFSLVLLALLKREPDEAEVAERVRNEASGSDANALNANLDAPLEIATIASDPMPISVASIASFLVDFLRSKVLAVLPLVACPCMRALVPSFVASGCLQSFIFGTFTADIIKPSLGTTQIGYVMSVYGLVQLLVLFCFGAAGDRLGKAYIAYIGYSGAIFLFCAYHVVTNLFSMSWLRAHAGLVYTSSALFAVADCSLYLFMKVMVSSLYPDRVAHAYSLLQFFKSFAMAMSFAIGPYFSLPTKLLLFLCISLAGLGATLVLFLRILPLVKLDEADGLIISNDCGSLASSGPESEPCDATTETTLLVPSDLDSVRMPVLVNAVYAGKT
jgi:MFS family permease